MWFDNGMLLVFFLVFVVDQCLSLYGILEIGDFGYNIWWGDLLMNFIDDFFFVIFGYGLEFY